MWTFQLALFYMIHLPLAISPSQTGVIKETNRAMIIRFCDLPEGSLLDEVNQLFMNVSALVKIKKNSTSRSWTTCFQLWANHISLKLSGKGCCAIPVNNMGKIITVIISA